MQEYKSRRTRRSDALKAGFSLVANKKFDAALSMFQRAADVSQLMIRQFMLVRFEVQFSSARTRRFAWMHSAVCCFTLGVLSDALQCANVRV